MIFFYQTFVCTYCSKNFEKNEKKYRNHIKTRSHLLAVINENLKTQKNQDFIVVPGKSAFKNRISTLIFINKEPEFTIAHFFNKINTTLTEYLKLYLRYYGSVKVNANLFCKYKKSTGEEQIFNLNTSNVTLFMNDEIQKKISKELFPQVEIQNDELNKGGSGWIFNSVSEMEVKVNKNDVMKKGGKFIELPNVLKTKKAIINIQNMYDDKCFYYCILAKFQKIRPWQTKSYNNAERKLKNLGIEFDFRGINYPVTMSDIKKFEKNNNHVSINVFAFEKGKISPIRVCDEEKKFHYDLLLLKNNKQNFHYAYIKNFSRLISSQLKKMNSAVEICKRCLVFYYGRNREKKIVDHKRYCNQKTTNPSRVILPPKDDCTLVFKKYYYETPLTYCVFADFETMLIPQNNENDKECSKIEKYQKHEPIAFSYYLVHAERGRICDPVCYVGENAADIFFEMMKKLALRVAHKYKKYMHVNYCTYLNEEELKRFHYDPYCCICKCKFGLGEKRVRHHSHITNLYIGPAHGQCNLIAKVPNFLPVFFHNLSKYDGHLILHGYKGDENDMRVIPTTEETYIGFSKKVDDNFWIRFVDSYRFLSSSLRTLVDNLPESKLVHTKSYFSEPELFNLINKKGYFCYDYLDNINKLQERNIPTKQNFYNKLTDEHISDENYAFVKKVWNSFKCRNLEDYIGIYVISDCLLLADVFLSFRNLCMEKYKIDPCYCFSLPGYAFEAMLKLTGVKFDLLTDIDQYLFLERALRGGICNTIIRYSEANNKHIATTFDPNKAFNTVFYTDCNNLYGFVMLDKLPIGDFTWLNDNEIVLFTVTYILSIPDDSDIGYYLEVDLKYPIELHDVHNALPFAPEKKPAPNTKISKLLCTLDDKKNYVIHYRNLKLCLKHNLLLQKIHKILKFKQSNFLQRFIDLNTSLRQQASNDFDRDLFKLMNNSCFGKFIENQRNRMNFKLITNEAKLEKSIAKPTFKSSVIFSEKLVGVHFYKSKVILNRPIFVGVTVLELSRNYMYEFYYEKLRFIFPSHKLLYMDTDSFILSAETDDIYPCIKSNLKYFDTSNYPSDHFCYSNVNHKIPGYFKDELYPKQCKRFISLCPKVYSLDLLDKQITKIKGVKHSVVQKDIHFDDFYNCLFENITLGKEIFTFKSIRHEMFTIKQNKCALNNICDKRYFYDNINSYAYGHYKIPPLDSANDKSDEDTE